jgi:Dynein heavy chain, N-terminal region 2
MEEKLKAMSTSLPLVGDLAHPAMRARHWEQLMRATGKTFVKDDKFTLGALINLGLHNYVDDCSEIVDRAQKARPRVLSVQGIIPPLWRICECWAVGLLHAVKCAAACLISASISPCSPAQCLLVPHACVCSSAQQV